MAINIYWSNHDGKNDNDWSILYEEPKSLYHSLSENREKENDKSFFNCPSFTSFSKNILVIRNPLKSHYFFENSFIRATDGSLAGEISHSPSIKNNILFVLFHSFIFFSEEEVELSMTSPFFHHAQHLKYGAIVPGKLNIGLWYRSLTLEFNLWEGVNELVLEKNEPIAYLHFNTSEKINLKRFYNTDKLKKISYTMANSAYWEPKVPLLKRYQRFKNSQISKIVLQEIKNNLIE
jgi:hypothetical protein